MKPVAPGRVQNAPAKPLMLFDGDCHFCRHWIERWRQATGSAVDYEPFQKTAAVYPEIPSSAFERAVQLIEPDGQVFSGAEAVLRALACGDRWLADWMLRLYQRSRLFAAMADGAYAVVAQNRAFASAGIRLLWGDDVRRSEFFAARRWFLRALGFTYLVAFVSLWFQIDGLIGARGILPVTEFLHAVHEQLGPGGAWQFPTLCWLNASNAFLHFLCAAGAGIAVLLMAEVAPLLCLLALFVLYLSLAVAGQTFLEFQWDILLLEAGFLAIFFAPMQWRRTPETQARVSRIGLFLLKLLLFKLIFLSGAVKLTSGDDTWWKLTAFDYHYWSQPLPTALAWFADKSPLWLKKATVAGTLMVELVVPFFIWAPRRLRLIAFTLLVLLQIGIAATGNYGFFNLLTVALALLLLDDSVIARSLPRRTTPPPSRAQRCLSVCAAVILFSTLPLNVMLIRQALNPEAHWPAGLRELYIAVQPLRIVNGYGLFRVMTKTRAEITVEGSADRITWLPYKFRWKPGDLETAPRWVAPHQPRLDWQMWFAALSEAQSNPWFLAFCTRLLENEPAVTGLLENNPFPAAPPRYLRATTREYRFTTALKRRKTGRWWTAGPPIEYLPPVALGGR